MKTVSVVLSIVLLLAMVSSASAVWSGNRYLDGTWGNYDATVKANINGGTDTGGYSYDTGPFDTGATYNFQLGGSGTKIWSAENIDFQSDRLNTHGYFAQVSSSFVVKVNLAEWIYAFNWMPNNGATYLTTGNSYDYKYSKDGVNWNTVYSVTPTVMGNQNPPPPGMFITCGDTKTLYLGYFGTWVNPGDGSGYAGLNEQHWVSEPAHPLAFWISSTPEPATLVMLGLGGLAMLRRRK
ncbi:MAG: PEP-CTERM sorting domain-containing protein [Phycisphaerae bacterium]